MDKVQFNATFAAFLKTIQEAEAITKRELGIMGNTLIAGVHGLGDAQVLIGELDYINRLLLVVTPMHRKLLVSFFKHFGGYVFDADKGEFTKKNKSAYMDALKAAKELLAGKCPLIAKEHPQNIWGWAEHLKVESPKVFNPDRVAKFVKDQIGLATGAGLSKLDVLGAVFEGGFTAQDVADMMELVAARKDALAAVDKAKGKKPEPAPV